MSNFKKLKVPEDIFYFTGVQFSANNRYLYVSYLSRIYQFDMESRDIQASIVVIGDVSHIPKDNQKGQLFEMRLAPDGKIYVASPFSHKYLSVINRPNCLGKLSDFRPYAVELKRFSYGGLPNIPIFEQPPANYTCDSLPSPTQELPESITLSPNPAQGIININTTKAFDKYIIINAMGQAVQSGKWNAAQSEIDVADLPEGIYFVQLLNNQSHTQAIGRFVLKK